MFCKQTLFSLLAFFLFSIIGCATHKSSIIAVQKMDEYPYRTTSDGISLAADPYDSTKKAKEGFYIDVTRKGFYPVNLIFKNDTNDRVIVWKETVELIDGSGNVHRPVTSLSMYNAFEKSKIAYALLGFGIFSYMSADEANRKMESDWRQKEFPQQLIIRPGRKANGVVYYQLPKGTAIKGSKLTLMVESLETKNKIQLELTFVDGK